MEENALVVSGLCRKQGKFELCDINFTLPKGYIMGLVGRMGSGKTTLLKSILNPSLIKSGSVEYEGQAGFIMEDAPFFIEATLKENMEVFKNLYKDYDEDEFYDRLKSVGLEPHKVYGLLSKGEKVRFQFAFAMGHHPSLLLLDEPTSGLDVVFCREFLYMLQEAVEKQMISVIFSTHLTNELERIADFIGVMDGGRLTVSKNEIADIQGQDAEIRNTETHNISMDNIIANGTNGHNTKIQNVEMQNTKMQDTSIYNTKMQDAKIHNGKAHGDKKKALLKSDMPDLKGVQNFYRGVYLKSASRFGSYIICFFQFIFGWVVFLVDGELEFASGFIAGLVFAGIMVQYMGLVTQKGAEKKVVLMRVGHFFGLEPWTLWSARMLCMLKSSWCFAAVAVVQFVAVTAIMGNGGAMFAVLGIIFADYVIVAVLTAIATVVMAVLC